MLFCLVILISSKTLTAMCEIIFVYPLLQESILSCGQNMHAQHVYKTYFP